MVADTERHCRVVHDCTVLVIRGLVQGIEVYVRRSLFEQQGTLGDKSGLGQILADVADASSRGSQKVVARNDESS